MFLSITKLLFLANLIFILFAITVIGSVIYIIRSELGYNDKFTNKIFAKKLKRYLWIGLIVLIVAVILVSIPIGLLLTQIQ